MTRRRAVLVASTGLALAATLVAAPADAQQAGPVSLDITPASGPAGTVITVSGDDCAPQQAFNAFAQVYFVNGTDVLTAVNTEIADTGSWSAQVQVPAGTDPAGAYSVFATCFVDDGETTDTANEYEATAFDVTPDEAAPPAPVPGDPTFTG